MHPKNISITDYRYDLPAASIAHHPLPERDASKLLIYQDGRIKESTYRHIAAAIPDGSLLVFNNTKVVEARIIFRKPTGGQIEIFCLEPPPDYGGVGQAMMQTGQVRWKCLIGGASKWKPGQVLTRTITEAAAETLTLEARYIDKIDGAFLVAFSWTPASLSFAGLLHQAGLIPLPPYIRRAPEAADSERYQTVYARHDGSVAAPTAGLHFTESIFGELAKKNINRQFVTLHVGAGTFLPVKSDTMEGHNMHVEYISVGSTTIRALLDHLSIADQQSTADSQPPSSAAPQPSSAAQQPSSAGQWPSAESQSLSTIPISSTDAASSGRLIIPVGTTSARTLESLYWLGLKTILDPGIGPDELVVNQWDAYDLPSETSAVKALHALLSWMDAHGLSELVTRTQLLITPGYRWRIAGALVTNFHQPESTLLLLVASLIGKDWKKLYDYALTHDFRFLSYGDGSLLFPAMAP